MWLYVKVSRHSNRLCLFAIFGFACYSVKHLSFQNHIYSRSQLKLGALNFLCNFFLRKTNSLGYGILSFFFFRQRFWDLYNWKSLIDVKFHEENEYANYLAKYDTSSPLKKKYDTSSNKLLQELVSLSFLSWTCRFTWNCKLIWSSTT